MFSSQGTRSLIDLFWAAKKSTDVMRVCTLALSWWSDTRILHQPDQLKPCALNICRIFGCICCMLLLLWSRRSDVSNFYNCVFYFIETCLYFAWIKFANLVLGVEAIFQFCFVRLAVAHLSDFPWWTQDCSFQWLKVQSSKLLIKWIVNLHIYISLIVMRCGIGCFSQWLKVQQASKQLI